MPARSRLQQRVRSPGGRVHARRRPHRSRPCRDRQLPRIDAEKRWRRAPDCSSSDCAAQAYGTSTTRRSIAARRSDSPTNSHPRSPRVAATDSYPRMGRRPRARVGSPATFDDTAFNIDPRADVANDPHQPTERLARRVALPILRNGHPRLPHPSRVISISSPFAITSFSTAAVSRRERRLVTGLIV